MYKLAKSKRLFVFVLLISLTLLAFNVQTIYATETDETAIDQPSTNPLKESAIEAADRAIRWLPRPDNIRFLPPNIENDIAEAQALVDTAKRVHGATDDDFADLEKLEAVKERVEIRKAIFAARDAIDLIPPPGTITEEDRDVIEEARRLVNIAIEDYGATDFDLCWRLRKLEISEERVDEKPVPAPEDPDDPEDPLPPTGAMVTSIVSGLLLLGTGLFFLGKRKGHF